jgi:hypothetical protein
LTGNLTPLPREFDHGLVDPVGQDIERNEIFQRYLLVPVDFVFMSGRSRS